MFTQDSLFSFNELLSLRVLPSLWNTYKGALYIQRECRWNMDMVNCWICIICCITFIVRISKALFQSKYTPKYKVINLIKIIKYPRNFIPFKLSMMYWSICTCRWLSFLSECLNSSLLQLTYIFISVFRCWIWAMRISTLFLVSFSIHKVKISSFINIAPRVVYK